MDNFLTRVVLRRDGQDCCEKKRFGFCSLVHIKRCEDVLRHQRNKCVVSVPVTKYFSVGFAPNQIVRPDLRSSFDIPSISRVPFATNS